MTEESVEPERSPTPPSQSSHGRASPLAQPEVAPKPLAQHQQSINNKQDGCVLNTSILTRYISQTFYSQTKNPEHRTGGRQTAFANILSQYVHTMSSLDPFLVCQVLYNKYLTSELKRKSYLSHSSVSILAWIVLTSSSSLFACFSSSSSCSSSCLISSSSFSLHKEGGQQLKKQSLSTSCPQAPSAL